MALCDCGAPGLFRTNALPVDKSYCESCFLDALAANLREKSESEQPPICAHGQYVLGLFERIAPRAS